MATTECTTTRGGWKVVKKKEGENPVYYLERKVKLVFSINFTNVYKENGKTKFFTARNLAQDCADYVSGCERDGRAGFPRRKAHSTGYMTYEEAMHKTLYLRTLAIKCYEEKEKRDEK